MCGTKCIEAWQTHANAITDLIIIQACRPQSLTRAQVTKVKRHAPSQIHESPSLVGGHAYHHPPKTPEHKHQLDVSFCYQPNIVGTHISVHAAIPLCIAYTAVYFPCSWQDLAAVQSRAASNVNTNIRIQPTTKVPAYYSYIHSHRPHIVLDHLDTRILLMTA